MAWCSACCGDHSGSEAIAVEPSQVPSAGSAGPDQLRSPRLAPAVIEEQKPEPAPIPSPSPTPSPSPAPAPAPDPTAAPKPTPKAKLPSRITEPQVFNVSIELNGQKLGIDINYHDGQTLLVTKVNDGPVGRYNITAPQDTVVCIGDCIVEANGVSGEVMPIMEALKREPMMKAVVKRAVEKCIHLLQAPGGLSHGIDAVPYDLGCLTLNSEPLPDTLLGKHNAEESDYLMKKDDYIVSVNGIRGSAAKLKEALGTGSSWEITYRRIERRKSP